MKTLFGLLMLCVAASAHAWGREGHQITGYVAEQLLSDAARQQVQALLPPGVDLARVSLWMDQRKARMKQQLPGSERWHYDDIPVCGNGPAPCADGNCASRQIPRWRAVLADQAAGKEERLQALSFVVHMVGDIHQPLHAADHDDKGGNAVAVSIPGFDQPRNLHALWDTQLVRRLLAGQGEAEWARAALAQDKARVRGWQQGGVADWLQESNALARSKVYAPLPGFACERALTEKLTLDDAYLDAALPTVRAQLLKAGARIAWVLNQDLR